MKNMLTSATAAYDSVTKTAKKAAPSWPKPVPKLPPTLPKWHRLPSTVGCQEGLIIPSRCACNAADRLRRFLCSCGCVLPDRALQYELCDGTVCGAVFLSGFIPLALPCLIALTSLSTWKRPEVTSPATGLPKSAWLKSATGSRPAGLSSLTPVSRFRRSLKK